MIDNPVRGRQNWLELTTGLMLSAIIGMTDISILLSVFRSMGFPDMPNVYLWLNGIAMAAYVSVHALSVEQAATVQPALPGGPQPDSDTFWGFLVRWMLLSLIGTTVVVITVALLRARMIPDVPQFYLLLNGMVFGTFIALQGISVRQARIATQRHVMELRRRLESEPENVRTAWDLGAVKLEDYLNRNLSQIKWIFAVAVFVMLCGFMFVLYGVSLSVQERLKPAYVASLAGIITEFISVTLWLYTDRQCSRLPHTWSSSSG